MDKVLYVAMTGARENMFAQQVHANNLANATTNGFKADLEQARSMRVFGDGHASRVYAMTENPATDTSEGTLVATGRDLDVAVTPGGWLAVQGVDGDERYTRAGELQIDVNGRLLAPGGFPVLGSSGAPILIPEASNVTIANDGTISIVPLGSPSSEVAQIDQIKLISQQNTQLFKGTDGLMRTQDGVPLPADQTVGLRTGFIESSNVNAVSELTNMITLSRQFEMQVKVMKAAEENSTAATKILQLS